MQTQSPPPADSQYLWESSSVIYHKIVVVYLCWTDLKEA